MSQIFSPNSHTVAKAIFENIRNSVACTTVAIAGVIIMRFPQISLFGPEAAPWISLLLVLVAAGLLMWNMALGIDTMLKELVPKSRWLWFVYSLVTAIFIVATISVLGALVKQQFAASPLKAIDEISVPNQGGHP